MASMKDIAERAGVSIATVSKVLNNQGGISQETAELIHSIAKELNYHPNFYARNLKKGASRAIGVITEDLTVFNSSPIVDGIGAYCDDHGYHYFLENMRLDRLKIDPIRDVKKYNEIVRKSISFMKALQVDGLIYLGCHSHKVLSLPEIDDTHCVFAYCSSSNPNIPSVSYDDNEASFEVANYLINAGHRSIGVITGPLASIHTQNRLIGYQKALFNNEIPYNPKLTVNGDWGRDSGYALAKQLIDNGVTAIFAQNDLMAMGVIDYCRKIGIEVGRDLALIGFDDREICTVCRPTLSSVSLPLFEIGQTSAEILINKIENKPSELTGEILLECKLIERESSRFVKNNT